MKLKKIIVLASLILAFIQIAAHAQTSTKPSEDEASKTEILELDRQLQEAMVVGDVKMLERYLGDDFVFTHGWLKGGTATKQQLLEDAKKQPRLLIYRKVSSQVIEMHGKIALVLGRLDVRHLPLEKNNETEQICYALNYAHLYERRKGRWQFLSHRTAQMIEPSKPCPK